MKKRQSRKIFEVKMAKNFPKSNHRFQKLRKIKQDKYQKMET